MCILIVEDEAIIRMLIEDILEEAGHVFMSASSGQEAIDVLAALPGHFTCLMTDFCMPNGVTGADLIDCARQSYPSIPMILATAMPDATAPEWRRTNGVELLVKPFGAEDVLSTLDRLLPRH